MHQARNAQIISSIMVLNILLNKFLKAEGFNDQFNVSVPVYSSNAASGGHERFSHIKIVIGV
jgi:hypothetical protein